VTILVWKNDGQHPKYAGKEFLLFRVSWDEGSGEWVRDLEGDYWGVSNPDDHQKNIRLAERPEHYGTTQEDFSVTVRKGTTIMQKLDSNISVPKLVLGRPELKEVDLKKV